MFSIVIPTYNNFKYLELCLNSIKKNSKYNHEIVLHINDGVDGSLEYAKKNKIKYSYSEVNIGLCSSINLASKLTTNKYLLYSHDDMYFCPSWDECLYDEINKIEHDNFYLSGTMIEPNSGHIIFNCGEDIESFDENKLLENISKLNFQDHQGSHFAPHLVSKKMWNDVGGFSEEFNPGIASDPDFNMKLWKKGVRIFKGLNNFKVYHFGSITTRKKKNFIQNRGDRTFLKKWGITTKFFKKHYLKSKTKYDGPLQNPKISFKFVIGLIGCKIRSIFTI
tara:strand:- start:62 stop:898 length:837 start_codon:yes stop_codon:yes gene_type:complete